MQSFRCWYGWAIIALVLLAVPCVAASTEFQADCAALTRNPHRLTGSTEYNTAAAYMAARFRALGVPTVINQSFPAMTGVVKQCSVAVVGRILPLFPMRPDGIIFPVTPAQGISGMLLYAGNGSLPEYGTRSPQDKIVVLNYNAGANWLLAFRLGARAVIFTGGMPADAMAPHYTYANANFPRYYYAGAPADLREGVQGTLKCQEVWQATTGRNIVAIIPGSKPTFSLGSPETIVIGANLDSYGEVPLLSRGARGAANCAALLQTAQYFMAHRPERTLALVAFGGESQGHLGSSAFYRTFVKDPPAVLLENRLQYVAWERKAKNTNLANLQDVRTLSASRDAVLFGRLSDKAEVHVSDLKAREAVLRMSMDDPSVTPVTRQQMQTSLHSVLQEIDNWSDLQRALVDVSLSSHMTVETRRLLDIVLGELRVDTLQRLAELTNEDAELASTRQLKTALGNSTIVLHVALMFGDTSPRWGLIVGGDSQIHAANDQPGLYGKIQGTFSNQQKLLALPNFEAATINGTMTSRLFWPGFLVHNGEICGRLGIYNIVAGTIQEHLAREGTPDDTLAALNCTRIETQCREFQLLLGATQNADGLSLRRAIVPDKQYAFPTVEADGKVAGPSVLGQNLSNAMPTRPTPGAVIELSCKPLLVGAYAPRRIPAFDNFQVLCSDANANYCFGPVPTDSNNNSLNAFAATFDEQGQVIEVSNKDSLFTLVTNIIVMPCTTLTANSDVPCLLAGALALPPQVDNGEAQVLQARSDGPFDTKSSFFQTTDGVVYWYAEPQVARVKLFGLTSMVALFRADGKARQGDPLGGFDLMNSWSFTDTGVRSANDLWQMDEIRMDTMRSRGVDNTQLEDLHGRAQDLLESAQAASAIDEKEALANSSFLAENPVYTMVRQGMDDLVFAVLILLALAVPFAYALERLLIGSTNIYKQISWFTGFFVVTFGILYLVHPAFSISNQPMIIFLAFALVVLSSLVIVVIMQKFQSELKEMQGLASTVHTGDVSRFGTMMVAVGMGISTMRRRPLRTALTAITIVLLTFTILNFASFDTRIDVVKLFSGASAKYTGVVMHRINWSSLSPDLLSLVNGRWKKNAVVVSRWWLPADVQASDGPLLTSDDGSHPLALRGVLGLDAAEIAQRTDLSKLLGSADGAALTGGVYLTQQVAKSLNVTVGQNVLLGGISLRIAGLLDHNAVAGVQDIDENGILPVDFSAMSSANNQQPSQAIPGADLLAAAKTRQDFVVLPTDSVVIVSSDVARQLGASLREITLYTPDALTAQTIAEDAARILPIPVVATRPDGIATHVLAPTVMAKGVKDLIFPLILGGLVIFGTMLGSVADREKEIYTFSALGLAPAHVAMLFLAEAMIYSSLGGLGGYLLAQGVQKGMTLLLHFGVIGSIPEMNYSSVNSIVTIVIVMVVVLLSSIYPAIKASHSANPGVMRTWRLPEPKGDQFDITFPFTISQYDFTGVLSFLREHFENFADTSLGVFMARDTRITRSAEGDIGLASLIALAPFDLGVTEEFYLRSAPSEIAGIDEVKIVLTRRSGQLKDWTRLNKVLLNDLRKQFLLWRAVSPEAVEMYRQQTLILLGEMPGKVVTKPVSATMNDPALA